MVQNINPSRLNTRLHLGVSAPIRTPQGTMKPGFKEVKKVWCGTYTISMNQQITLLGAPDSFDIVLIVRHLKGGLDGLKYAEFRKAIYEITNYTPDWEDTAHSFDLITLKKVDAIV